MQLQHIYEHLARRPGAEEGFPFGEQALVFKVGGKMFAILAPDELPPRVTLKCDPEEALRLRETYEGVQPGYHMNKRHWNTVLLDDSVPLPDLRVMIENSYDLVVANLPRSVREALGPQPR